jgi:hypothetical protein
MSRPPIQPWGFFSRFWDITEAFGRLFTVIVGAGGMTAWLATSGVYEVPWYQVFVLTLGVGSLVAIAYVQVADYIRRYSIERAVRLKNVVPFNLAIGADGGASVALAGSIENTSPVLLYVKLDRGHIALQGRTPEQIQIATHVLAIEPGTSARVTFPTVADVNFGRPMLGKLALGLRFGRRKSDLTHFYYTEGEVILQVTQDQSGATIHSQDTVTETMYGRAPKED